jgi:hypothetical protein
MSLMNDTPQLSTGWFIPARSAGFWAGESRQTTATTAFNLHDRLSRAHGEEIESRAEAVHAGVRVVGARAEAVGPRPESADQRGGGGRASGERSLASPA